MKKILSIVLVLIFAFSAVSIVSVSAYDIENEVEVSLSSAPKKFGTVGTKLLWEESKTMTYANIYLDGTDSSHFVETVNGSSYEFKEFDKLEKNKKHTFYVCYADQYGNELSEKSSVVYEFSKINFGDTKYLSNKTTVYYEIEPVDTTIIAEFDLMDTLATPEETVTGGAFLYEVSDDAILTLVETHSFRPGRDEGDAIPFPIQLKKGHKYVIISDAGTQFEKVNQGIFTLREKEFREMTENENCRAYHYENYLLMFVPNKTGNYEICANRVDRHEPSYFKVYDGKSMEKEITYTKYIDDRNGDKYNFNLTEGHEYIFKLSDQTNCIGATYIGDSDETPEVPLNVKATLGHDMIKITWDKVNNADSYQIYYRKDYLDTYKLCARVNSSSTSYAFTSPKVRESYQFGVSAKKNSKESSIRESGFVFYIVPGWYTDPKTGEKYYVSEDLKEYYGMHEIDGKTYYFSDKTDALQYGFINDMNKWYYFKPKTGEMLKGWQFIDESYFYFDKEDGHMYLGLQYVEESNGYFYFKEKNESGRMQTGWQKIDGLWYYFKGGTSGRMLTGWQFIDGSYFYLDPKDGHMYEGLKYVEESKGYFFFKENGSGRMLTGWQKIDGLWYYFKGGTSGRMQTGWLLYNNNYYYLEENENNNIGHMYLGFQRVEAKGYTPGYFYFREENESGRVETGWKKIDGYWYYFKDLPSGRMLTGWITIGNNKYYCDLETGRMYTGYHTIDGIEYHFKEGDSGRLIN